MGFEKLRVYQAAELLDDEAQKLITIIPAGFGKDIDHLKRAAASTPYNIAEAYGSEQPGRKRNHLEIARGSADEVRAICKRLVARKALPRDSIVKACALTSVIAKMLTAWIDKLDAKP